MVKKVTELDFYPLNVVKLATTVWAMWKNLKRTVRPMEEIELERMAVSRECPAQRELPQLVAFPPDTGCKYGKICHAAILSLRKCQRQMS